MNATVEKTQQELVVPNESTGLTTSRGWELAQRVAKALSASTLVPKEYQNNLPNCIIALEIANRVGASPLLVMQNLYVVHGRPGWSSQFLIATFNQCGRFSAMRFEFFGEEGKDSRGCRAWAIEKSTGDKLVGSDITIAIAKKEGWYQKAGSKWQTMEQQMLMYRSASWFVRVYAPELSMGLQTQDELRDVGELQQMHVTQAGRSPELLGVIEQELATGAEKTGNADPAIVFTTQEVHDAIAGAKTKESLDEALDLVNALPKKDQQALRDLGVVVAGKFTEA